MIVLRTPRAEGPAEVRLYHTGSARDLLGVIRRDRPTYAVHAGHVSLAQLLLEILRQTDPAHVVICAWSATENEMAMAGRALRNASMLSLTLVTERNWAGRQMERLRFHFPGARVVGARAHAKYATIRNDEWNLAVTSTMNLAQQPRMEGLFIRDSAELCDMLMPADALGETLAPAPTQTTVAMGWMTPPPRMASVGQAELPL